MTTVAMTLRLDDKMKAAIEAIAAAEGGGVNARINRFIMREVLAAKLRHKSDLVGIEKIKSSFEWALEIAKDSPDECVYADDVEDEFTAEMLFSIADGGDERGKVTVADIHNALAFNAECRRETIAASAAVNAALADIGADMIDDDGTLKKKTRDALPKSGPDFKMIKRLLKNHHLNPAQILSGKAPLTADALESLHLWLSRNKE